jgi:hypothetical protein
MSELERIFDRVSTRLNNVLCEMKPGYDDSIVGFNEAWDVMRAVFKDELTKATSRTPDEPQAAPVRDPMIAAIASLAAAISLLERTPKAKKAAPSDKMFDQMLADYRKALANARAALSLTRPEPK